MKRFDHIISLGYFCSVASDLERLGLRSASSPFDWCISNFEGVISAIGHRFDGFLDYGLLSQSTAEGKDYFNSRYRIWFFHDFDEYRPLGKQLDAVAAKYKRRIDRFYENISHPTLFIRYISNETVNQDGKSEELDFIEHHYDDIVSLLKSFNGENEIIFLANREVESEMIDIYHVSVAENATSNSRSQELTFYAATDTLVLTVRQAAFDAGGGTSMDNPFDSIKSGKQQYKKPTRAEIKAQKKEVTKIELEGKAP